MGKMERERIGEEKGKGEGKERACPLLRSLCRL